jgi:NAD(P)-dependent dehydrogenase (short-subunit alcohol dehydrogenase family)
MSQSEPKKIALVTGASRGLGAALALALSTDHHVVAVAKTTGALEDLDDRIRAAGGEATLAPMDITIPEAMTQLARSIYDRWGRLDTWAHCAIYAAPLTPAAHLEAGDMEKSLAVNVTATAHLIAMVEPLLNLAPAGRALFFDDPRAGQKFFGYYGASKAAQMAIVQSWRAETVTTGPAVHIATPAPMPTATRGRFFPGEDRSPLASPEAEARRVLDAIA